MLKRYIGGPKLNCFMEPPLLQPEKTVVDTADTCASCGCLLHGHRFKTNLCAPCRVKFIRYPIPLWIKAFGGGILLILLFSLFALPGHIQTGMHYKRGTVAAGKKLYASAEREFAQVVKTHPSYIEAQCRLLLAAYYNNDYPTVVNTYGDLKGKTVKDEQLAGEVTAALDAVSRSYPSDSFIRFAQSFTVAPDSIPIAAYYEFLKTHDDEGYAELMLANLLFDKKQYNAAGSIADRMLQRDARFYGALILKAPLKREEQQFDSAYYYIDRMVTINRENVVALASKVRVLLKEKRDVEALKLAKSCYEKDKKDGYVLASLALAYHYAGDIKNRDVILGETRRDSSNASSFIYVTDIISGKETFRN